MLAISVFYITWIFCPVVALIIYWNSPAGLVLFWTPYSTTQLHAYFPLDPFPHKSKISFNGTLFWYTSIHLDLKIEALFFCTFCVLRIIDVQTHSFNLKNCITQFGRALEHLSFHINFARIPSFPNFSIQIICSLIISQKPPNNFYSWFYGAQSPLATYKYPLTNYFALNRVLLSGFWKLIL